MGVEVKGLRSGYESNVESYSITEDATTLDPSSSSGGVGSMTVSAQDYSEASWLLGDLLDLSDTNRGKFQGLVRSTKGNASGSLSITADSILAKLNVTRTIPPYWGPLSGAIQHVMDAMLVTNPVSVDSSIASRTVVLHGFYDNVWDNLRRFLIAQQVELSLVFNTVMVRPIRKRDAYLERLSDNSWSVDSSGVSKSVTVHYYPTNYGDQLEIYPVAGTTPPTLSVDAGETVETEVQLNASVRFVNQPVCVSTVQNRPYGGTQGVYSVAGGDGLPITPSQWAAQGGFVWVGMTDDPRVLKIVVRGMDNPDLQPYRIAMTAGTSSYYPSLHVTGTASVWTDESITLITGAPQDITVDDSTAQIENPYVRTLSQAVNVGVQAAKAHAGVVSQVSGSAGDLNRPGGTSEGERRTIAEFNAERTAGSTVASYFGTVWAGQTIKQFNAAQAAITALLFGNQSFGNAVGARLKGAEANYRIDSTTTTQDGISFSASSDTTIADFNSRWSGQTIASFNGSWSGRIVREFATKPLRR